LAYNQKRRNFSDVQNSIPNNKLAIWQGRVWVDAQKKGVRERAQGFAGTSQH